MNGTEWNSWLRNQICKVFFFFFLLMNVPAQYISRGELCLVSRGEIWIPSRAKQEGTQATHPATHIQEWLKFPKHTPFVTTSRAWWSARIQSEVNATSEAINDSSDWWLHWRKVSFQYLQRIFAIVIGYFSNAKVWTHVYRFPEVWRKRVRYCTR